MKKITTILILILFTTRLFSQVAVIDDKDGFTNVRENPDGKSKVIYKIQEFELFLYEMESSENNDWIKVFVPKNKYSLDCNGFDNLIGYIHKSRLKPIEELEKYNGEEFKFKYVLDTFSFENKIIDYADGKWISRINGRPFYGTDGDVPNNEVKSIDIMLEGEKIVISELLYADLFVLTNDFNIYRTKDQYFVQQWNSDGAGGYLIVWHIDKSGVKQRLILIP